MISLSLLCGGENETWTTTTKSNFESSQFPRELVSFDVTGPFRTASIHGNKYGLIFIDHFTNTPFNYAMKSKDEFPNFLQQFF
jgi:hypothetical protein